MSEPIPLSEKLYLLGIHPKKGGIIAAAATSMDYVILGGLILEMQLTGNIQFENKRIKVLSSKSENKLHVFLLEKMSRQNRNLKVGSWISKFDFSLRKIRRQVQQDLVDKRLIRMSDRRFLFFSWKSPVIVNREVVYHLVDKVDRIIFKGHESEEELMLVSLLQPAKLMSRVFSSKERRSEAKKRIKKISAANQVSVAVSEAIEAAQAVAASIAATTAAHSSVT